MGSREKNGGLFSEDLEGSGLRDIGDVKGERLLSN